MLDAFLRILLAIGLLLTGLWVLNLAAYNYWASSFANITEQARSVYLIRGNSFLALFAICSLVSLALPFLPQLAKLLQKFRER